MPKKAEQYARFDCDILREVIRKMALITTKDMFAKALTRDYAVGAFNVNNMEIIQGIVDAA